MRRMTVIWLIVAACLVIIGSIVLGVVMMFLKWDFTKLSTVEYETNTYEITEDFNDILIDTNTAEIEFILSENENCKVVCYEETKAKHSVSVENNVLSINVVQTKKWYDYIGIFNGTPKITLYLPKKAYNILSIKDDTGSISVPKDFKFESIEISTSTGYVQNYASSSGKIKIKTSTGSINICDITAVSLDLWVSTGKISVSSVSCAEDISMKVSTGKTELSDVKCKNLTSKGDTGKISLDDVIASDKIYVERSTGDVSFNRCDAAEIFVETDTGDINGSFLSNKVFITETDTGSINVPATTDGGKCEISTDTGDIKITIEE